MKFEVRALLGDTVHTQLIEAISEEDAVRILATQGFLYSPSVWLGLALVCSRSAARNSIWCCSPSN